MATIAEEIAAVREALASGVLRVRTRTNGVEKEVQYPSAADLLERLGYLERQQAIETGRKLPRVGLGVFHRGGC